MTVLGIPVMWVFDAIHRVLSGGEAGGGLALGVSPPGARRLDDAAGRIEGLVYSHF